MQRSKLGLWDTVSIIVGIIVGVGIYEAPADVFGYVSAPWQVLAVWGLGGLLSLLGALCYAELASAYPRSGGEYVYLTRAYGSPVGFLFAWAQLVVIRPGGGIAMPAFILADSAARLLGLSYLTSVVLAAVAIAALTAINVLGATPGKWTQNLLTLAKVLTLAGIVLAGFFLRSDPAFTVSTRATEPVTFVAMMMAVLYAFDGWNEAATVSHEVHNGRRNLPLALIIGTLLVTVIYVLVNGAYIVGLGFDNIRGKDIGAVTILQQTLGPIGGQVMDALIVISVLGALTGMIFTGSRIFSEMGTDHRLFRIFGVWDRHLQTPVWSLILQGCISIAMLLGVAVFGDGQSGFYQLLKWTAPVFWLFYLLTSMSLFVLRWKEPQVERPFPVPGYPLVPLLFCGWCAFMLWGSVTDSRMESMIGFVIVLGGLPFYFLSQALPPAPTKGPPSPLSGDSPTSAAIQPASAVTGITEKRL